MPTRDSEIVVEPLKFVRHQEVKPSQDGYVALSSPKRRVLRRESGSFLAVIPPQLLELAGILDSHVKFVVEYRGANPLLHEIRIVLVREEK